MDIINQILNQVRNFHSALRVAHQMGFNLNDHAERAFTIPQKQRESYYNSIGLPQEHWQRGDQAFRQIADGFADLAVLSATKGSVQPDD